MLENIRYYLGRGMKNFEKILEADKNKDDEKIFQISQTKRERIPILIFISGISSVVNAALLFFIATVPIPIITTTCGYWKYNCVTNTSYLIIDPIYKIIIYVLSFYFFIRGYKKIDDSTDDSKYLDTLIQKLKNIKRV